MSEKISIDSLRKAIKSQRAESEANDLINRFEKKAKKFEQAVAHLNRQVEKVIRQVPELSIEFEDEEEVFTSPAYPGMSKTVHDQILKITLEDDYLIFDPTGRSYSTTFGQIQIQASKPLPMLVEKTLYLMENPRKPRSFFWGYRSAKDFGQKIYPFNQETLLTLLKAIFA
jgi:hypothetical protein